VWLVLIERSLLNNLAQQFGALAAYPVCFLTLASGQTEPTWIQNGPVGFKKIYNLLEKQYTVCKMMILCQASFKEQTEKLVRLLLYITENC